MKPGMINLSKWAAKTVGAVERICLKKEALCVGFSLVFFDPLAADEERWSCVIELAFDPNNPPREEQREQLQQAFEYISEGVRRIMDWVPEAGDLEDYSREVLCH